MQKVRTPPPQATLIVSEAEIDVLTAIQYNLLPKAIPQIEGYDISAYYRPCRNVSGDYYDFIKIDESHLAILVADVSGKGIPASMIMTETRALVRSEATRTLSPVEVIKRVNQLLYNDLKPGMFVTIFYTILDTKNSVLSYVSGGHNPMIFLTKSTEQCTFVNTNGMAIGIDKGPLFERTIKEDKINIYPGDRFVLYTDGVTDTINENNVMFGDRRLALLVKQLSSKGSNELINLIVKHLEEHQGKVPQYDDITIVSCKRIK